ncbi:MAG: amidase family protein, partial [Cyclobacteriaceae bacterium]|nr:amidase family protein [Cyclobacteriaceae bacterium]
MKSYYLSFIFLSFFVNCSVKEKDESIKSPTEDIESFFDLNFTKSERDSMQEDLEQNKEYYQKLHSYKLENAIPPAIMFNPIPVGFKWNKTQELVNFGLKNQVTLPENRDELAFYPVADLAVLIKSRKITSMELTQLYLNRLKKYGDTLQCIIVITEELALSQAKKADEEIAAGQYRGPLHGIPYGIKDLLTLDGYNTTW